MFGGHAEVNALGWGGRIGAFFVDDLLVWAGPRLCLLRRRSNHNAALARPRRPCDASHQISLPELLARPVWQTTVAASIALYHVAGVGPNLPDSRVSQWRSCIAS